AVLLIADTVAAVDTLTWRVRPAREITPRATGTHGISNAEVTDRPHWRQGAPEVYALLCHRVVVMHRARVRYPTLCANLPGLRVPPVLDTLRLAQRVWPRLDDSRLGALAAHAGRDTSDVPRQGHRAVADAWGVWRLLCVLAESGDLTWPSLLDAAAVPDLADG